MEKKYNKKPLFFKKFLIMVGDDQSRLRQRMVPAWTWREHHP